MYCPNCKQEFEGKFCPECGTKLIEKPALEGGMSINLGDANAISGDINLHDSHDVTNVDNSVHNITNNTTNITNIAAQKTEMELLQERKVEFMKIVNQTLADGVISQEEMMLLENERLRIGLDAISAKRLIESAKNNIINMSKSGLNPTQLVIMKQITKMIDDNDTERLGRQLSRLEGIANSTNDEHTQFIYYLSVAALDPDKLISEYESSTSDDYWMVFWSYIAYTKKNDFKKAEDVLNRLSLNSAYSYENTVLLSTVGAMREFGNETALTLIESLSGNYHEYLEPFAKSLYLLLEPTMAEEFGATTENCAFYTENLLQFEDEQAKIERERAEANKRYTLRMVSVGNNSFKISMILKSSLGISLSEAKVLMDCSPIEILKNASRDKYSELYEKLTSNGAKVDIIEM